jgi:aspartate aminotransferase
LKISDEITDSPTLKFSQLAREKNERGERIISLGLGEPGFATPEPIVAAAVQALADGCTRYSNPRGLYELRQALQKKLLRENGLDIVPEDIVVTPGAKAAIMLALMALLRPGDEVINITPCYVSYVPQVKIAEPTAVVHNVDLKKGDFALDMDAIERAINERTRVLLLNSPHNPTGKVLTEVEVKGLVDLLADTGCYIISDEIYERLVWSDKKHVSIGRYAQLAERVVTVNGFSKAYSMTGWRIGYLTANTSLIGTIIKLQQHINTNTTTFVQKAACAALAMDQSPIETYVNELGRKTQLLQAHIGSHASYGLVPPEGGLFAFVDISRTGMDSDAFATRLLEEKNVAVTPGIGFGENWDDHVRLSLAAPYDEFSEGVMAVGEFIG